LGHRCEQHRERGQWQSDRGGDAGDHLTDCGSCHALLLTCSRVVSNYDAMNASITRRHGVRLVPRLPVEISPSHPWALGSKTASLAVVVCSQHPMPSNRFRTVSGCDKTARAVRRVASSDWMHVRTAGAIGRPCGALTSYGFVHSVSSGQRRRSGRPASPPAARTAPSTGAGIRSAGRPPYYSYLRHTGAISRTGRVEPARRLQAARHARHALTRRRSRDPYS
jgi:hypothetical protein